MFTSLCTAFCPDSHNTWRRSRNQKQAYSPRYNANWHPRRHPSAVHLPGWRLGHSKRTPKAAGRRPEGGTQALRQQSLGGCPPRATPFHASPSEHEKLDHNRPQPVWSRPVQGQPCVQHGTKTTRGGGRGGGRSVAVKRDVLITRVIKNPVGEAKAGSGGIS